MFCSHCGSQVAPDWSTCPKCGTPLMAVPGGAVPPPPPQYPTQERLAEHIHLLAVLWFVWAGVLLIPAIVMAILAGIITIPLSSEGAPRIAFVLAPGVFTILCLFFVAGSVLRFVAGWGLLKRRPWARTFALVMSFLELIHPPLGTMLGAYGLFVLLPANAAAQYERMAEAV